MRILWWVAWTKRLRRNSDSSALVSAVTPFLIFSLVYHWHLLKSWNAWWLNPFSLHLNLWSVSALISIWTLGFKCQWEQVCSDSLFSQGICKAQLYMVQARGCQSECICAIAGMWNPHETLGWTGYCMKREAEVSFTERDKCSSTFHTTEMWYEMAIYVASVGTDI